jgi:hypothetical protein
LRIFGPKRDEVKGDLRKLHNEELLTHYCAGDKIEKIRWAGHVARMGRGEACTVLWWRNLRERDHRGDAGVDGRIILRWIIRNLDVGVWTGLSWVG